MKKLKYIVLAALWLVPNGISIWTQAADGSTSLPAAAAPVIDTQGRFWIYRNGPTQPRMPFSPYGWMSDVTNNLSQLIHVDLEHRERPNTTFRVAGQAEKENCIKVKITWNDAGWAGIAFISGPDKPPWWGDSNRGRYFNLNSLPKKKLVFYARGERGGEVIKVQLGVLAGKPFGDSLQKPIMSEDLTLTAEWTKQEVDIKGVPSAELARICNGFGIVVDQASQPGPGTETQFYLDDVYYE
jgi:hypothetical protein